MNFLNYLKQIEANRKLSSIKFKILDALWGEDKNSLKPEVVPKDHLKELIGYKYVDRRVRELISEYGCDIQPVSSGRPLKLGWQLNSTNISLSKNQYQKSNIFDNKIGSIRTFIDKIEKLDLDGTSEYSYYFRGHANANEYKLEPSIFRKESWIKNEHRMFREVIIKCPDDFSNSNSTFEKLVKMQHYSLPTRLLDITGNPLAALFFACRGSLESDGEVIILKIPKSEIKYYDSDTVSVIANVAKRPDYFDISEKSSLELCEFNNDSSIKYLLQEIKEEKPYFEPRIISEHLESVVCVKPKLDNPRIIRQDGAFLLFGMNGSKLKRAKMPDGYQVTSSSRRMIIGKQWKKKILDQLKVLGISEANMFPEIDSVSNHLKNVFLSD